MTDQLAPTPIFKAFTNDGKPLAGGLLYSFQAGTSTPQGTFQDSVGTPNTNPIVLNFRGEASVWLDPTLTYKLQLTDSLGNTIPGYPVDNIVGGFFLTQQIVGQYLWPRTAAEVLAGVTPTFYYYEPYDIRRYGADFTGSNPSDVALSNAILVCGSTGGTIRFPNGVYSFASQIGLSGAISIILQGDGAAEGGAQPATQLVYTGTTSPWFNINSASGVQIRGMQLEHTNAAFSGTYVQNGSGSSFCGIFDCVVGSAVGGAGNIHLDLDHCQEFTGERCNFIYGNPSVRGAQAGGFSNVIAFRSCRWGSSYVAPVQDGGQAWSFSSCAFEPLVSTGPGGILSSASGRTFTGLVIEGCWFGDATATVGTWIDIYGQSASIKGNYISGNQTGTTAIALEGFHAAVIEGNTFAALLNGVNCAISACDQMVLSGNVFNSVTNPVANTSNVTVGTWTFGSNFGLTFPTGHGLAATNGYVAEPNGLIRQWGLVNPASFGNHTVSFPRAFASACYNIVISLSSVASTAATIFPSNLTTTTFDYTLVDGTSTTDSFYWSAIGK